MTFNLVYFSLPSLTFSFIYNNFGLSLLIHYLFFLSLSMFFFSIFFLANFFFFSHSYPKIFIPVQKQSNMIWLIFHLTPTTSLPMAMLLRISSFYTHCRTINHILRGIIEICRALLCVTIDGSDEKKYDNDDMSGCDGG